jgi:hypothetical protein
MILLVGFWSEGARSGELRRATESTDKNVASVGVVTSARLLANRAACRLPDEDKELSRSMLK